MTTLSRILAQTSFAAGNKKHFSWAALIIIAVLIMTPAFVQIFLNIVYPEKMVILTLALFMLFAIRAFSYGQTADYLLAAFTAAIATYTKEPVFEYWRLSPLLF